VPEPSVTPWRVFPATRHHRRGPSPGRSHQRLVRCVGGYFAVRAARPDRGTADHCVNYTSCPTTRGPHRPPASARTATTCAPPAEGQERRRHLVRRRPQRRQLLPLVSEHAARTARGRLLRARHLLRSRRTAPPSLPTTASATRRAGHPGPPCQGCLSTKATTARPTSTAG
jgi:hypothetical protein